MKQPYPGLRGGPEEVTFNFRFQGAAAGANNPDFFFGSGGLVTGITRDLTGEYSITFDKAFRFEDVVVCHVSPEADTFGGKFVSWTQATGVLEVATVVQDGSSIPGDITEDTWVHVSLTLCRRTELAQLQAI